MKILLFTGYGGYAATPQMRKILNKYEGIRGRIGEIIDYVENNYTIYDDSNYFTARKELENNKELIVKIKDVKKSDNSQVYLVWNETIYSTSSFSIIDVDTTRPWTIRGYDGSEYIEYLDENILLDEELNYYEKN